jgi:hypothetical protein
MPVFNVGLSFRLGHFTGAPGDRSVNRKFDSPNVLTSVFELPGGLGGLNPPQLFAQPPQT